MTEAKIYLGIPTYDGRVGEGIVNAIAESSALVKSVHIESGSLLPQVFNQLYASALNARSKGFTHFAMLHEDVAPVKMLDTTWIAKLLSIMERVQCDLLSVVIPLKSPHGLTSTALDEPMTDDPHWRVRRLTLTEVMRDYQPTFTHEKLLINTGLMLIDLRAPWVDKLWFEFESAIIQKEGKFIPVAMSEDWNFARRARVLGAKIWATREIPVIHTGKAKYANTQPWGLWKTDQ